jgi:hypothetical protein
VSQEIPETTPNTDNEIQTQSEPESVEINSPEVTKLTQ